ncbi:MAG: hypothetical protein PGN15_12660 [Aeromicrobium erythreum]
MPLVLRRYDEASSSESLESLSPLSRVISRRGHGEPTEDATDEVPLSAPVDTPTTAAEPTPKAPTVTETPTARRDAPTPPCRGRRRPSPPSHAADPADRARRGGWARRLLRGLAGLGGRTGRPGGGLGSSPAACRSGPSAASAARRRSVVRCPSRLPSVKLPARDTAAERASRRAAPRTPDEEHTVVVSHQFEDVEPDRKHVMERAELPADALEEKLQIAVPSVSTAGTALWDPLPVTLPTYVTKPRVGRTVRTIDFDAPGAWTSGHVEGEDVELPGHARSAQAAPETSRRASGE